MRVPPASGGATPAALRAHDAMDGGVCLYDKKLHVAPMLAVTDRHYRQLCRLLSRHAVLWTEMVHADAVLHNGARLLPFDAAQQPCVLQLGGSLPEALARAAAVGAGEYGYTEINLNVRRDSVRRARRAAARGHR